jgi:hypothetical protein
MTTHVQLPKISSPKRQGRLLAFGITGAMALAVSACGPTNSTPSPTLLVPPQGFNPKNATYYSDTNQPPTNSTVYATSSHGGYLGSCGYYRVYGYPDYYYRPAPGTSVELVSGGDTAEYSASSPDAARSVARGGFGEGGGEGEGGHGGFGGGEGGGE